MMIFARIIVSIFACVTVSGQVVYVSRTGVKLQVE
jgi:hypothetical protein